PLSIQPRRFSIRLPRPLWIGSVAGVLVVVAVGLPIGVPGYRQYVAIREIEEVGGRVETYARGPEWLRRQFGDCQGRKPFDEVVSVHIATEIASDTTLVHLRAFDKLMVAGLACPNVTNAGLVNLEGKSHLELVSLNGTQVTDEGLVHLSGLTSLHSLML